MSKKDRSNGYSVPIWPHWAPIENRLPSSANIVHLKAISISKPSRCISLADWAEKSSCKEAVL